MIRQFIIGITVVGIFFLLQPAPEATAHGEQKHNENSQHISETVLLTLVLEEGKLVALMANKEGNAVSNQKLEISGLILKNSKFEKATFVRTGDNRFETEANYKDTQALAVVISVTLSDGVIRQLRFQLN